jgi:transposase
MALTRYALTDEQWAQIAETLPGREGSVGVTAKDNRCFVDAVVYKFRTGIPWRDLPERFGHWHRIYVRFHRWSKKGIWQQLFEHLSSDPNKEYALLDSTVVRAHRNASGALKKGALPRSPKHSKHWDAAAVD